MSCRLCIERDRFRATHGKWERRGHDPIAGRFRIHTPLIQLAKADIIRLGASLGVDYGLTHSCYDPAADGAASAL